MSREDDLLKRFTLRTRGEEFIQELIKDLIANRNKEIATKWMSQDRYEMEKDGYKVTCNKKGDFFVNGEEFPYNFIYVNQVCQSLLLDEDGV